MSTPPDDLQPLLSEIHKTISDNRRFLQSLMDDADTGSEPDVDEEERSTHEDFEEL